MTATANNVVSLDSRRPEPPPTVRCRCRPGDICYSHRVANLAAVLRTYRQHHAAELLTTAADVEEVFTHALDVLDHIVDETLPDENRSTAR